MQRSLVGSEMCIRDRFWVHIGAQKRLQADLCVQRGFGLDRKTVDKVCGSIQNCDAVTMAIPRGVLVVLEDNVVQGDRISELLWLESVFNEHWLVLFADASGSSRGSRATNLAFWVAWKMGEHVMCPLGFHATWARQFLRFWRRRRAFYF